VLMIRRDMGNEGARSRGMEQAPLKVSDTLRKSSSFFHTFDLPMLRLLYLSCAVCGLSGFPREATELNSPMLVPHNYRTR